MEAEPLIICLGCVSTVDLEGIFKFVGLRMCSLEFGLQLIRMPAFKPGECRFDRLECEDIANPDLETCVKGTLLAAVIVVVLMEQGRQSLRLIYNGVFIIRTRYPAQGNDKSVLGLTAYQLQVLVVDTDKVQFRWRLAVIG